MARRPPTIDPQLGQATLEYVAVVTLVALVVGATVLLGPAAAPGLANAIGTAMRHAICIVTGGGCAVDKATACVTRSETKSGKLSAKIAIVGVGRDMALLRSSQSDGTVTLTLLDHLSAGVAGGVGADGHLQFGDVDLAAGGRLAGDATARLGGGRSWTVRGDAAADKLQRKLYEVVAGRVASQAGPPGLVDLGQRVFGIGAHRKLPDPDTTTQDAGAALAGDAILGVSALKLDATAVVGRTSARGGATTWYLQASGAVAPQLAGAVGVVAGAGRASIALTVDRDGRPRELTVSAQGRLDRTATVDFGLAATSAHGGLMQASARLDLTDAANRAAADAVVANLRPGRATQLSDAVVGLAETIKTSSAIDVAAYRTSHKGLGGAATVGLGPEVGLDAQVADDRQTLIAAWSRPPGGVWARRLDCHA